MKTLRLLLVPLAAIAMFGPSRGQPSPSDGEDQLESLIIAVRVRDRVAADALPAILVDRTRLFVPMKQICAILGLSTIETPAELRGDFMKPNRSFVYDVRTENITVAQSKSPSTRSQVRFVDNEMYLSIDVLDAWLLTKSEFSYAKLDLRIVPSISLPVEDTWALRARSGEGGSITRPKSQPPADLKQPEPAMFTVPVVDFDLATYRNREEIGKTGTDLYQRYSLLASNDLFNMKARWSLVGSWSDPLQTFRFQLSRTALDRSLLGAMKARSVSLGDSWYQQIPYVSNVRQGRGFEITSFPSTHTADMNATTIVGITVPGSRVELYREGLLIDIVNADNNGNYSFGGVPLLVGDNGFRILSLGPNGEARSESKHLFVGSGYTKPGETNYRISALQEFINGGNELGSWRWLAEVEHGFRSGGSFTARFSSIPVRGKQISYYSFGIKQSLGNAITSLDFIRNTEGAVGAIASLQARVRRTNITASVAGFEGGFTSEAITPIGAPLKFEATARLDSSVTIGPGFPLFGSLSVKYRTFETGTSQLLVTTRFSGLLGSTYFSNSVHMRSFTDTDNTELGLFTLRRKLHGNWLRGEVGYGLDDPILRSLSIGIETGNIRTMRSHFGIREQFDQSEGLSLFLNLSRHSDQGDFGLDLQLDHRGKLFGGITYSTSFGADPRNGNVVLLPSGSASVGSISVRAFIDTNASGKFDSGDVPLVGASFMAGKRKLIGKTDKNGVLLLTGFSPNVPLRLTIDPDSVEDPAVAISIDPIWVMPSVGAASQVEFPIVLRSF